MCVVFIREVRKLLYNYEVECMSDLLPIQARISAYVNLPTSLEFPLLYLLNRCVLRYLESCCNRTHVQLYDRFERVPVKPTRHLLNWIKAKYWNMNPNFLVAVNNDENRVCVAYSRVWATRGSRAQLTRRFLFDVTRYDARSDLTY